MTKRQKKKKQKELNDCDSKTKGQPHNCQTFFPMNKKYESESRRNWRKCCVFACDFNNSRWAKWTKFAAIFIANWLFVAHKHSMAERSSWISRIALDQNQNPFVQLMTSIVKIWQNKNMQQHQEHKEKKRTRNSINSCEHLLKIHWFKLTKNEKNSKQ